MRKHEIFDSFHTDDKKQQIIGLMESFYQLNSHYFFPILQSRPFDNIIPPIYYIPSNRHFSHHQQYLFYHTYTTQTMELQGDVGGYGGINSNSNQPYQNLSEQQNFIASGSNNQYSYKSGDTLGHLENGLAGSARKSFIFKVYSILAIQLLITTGMCFVSYFVEPFLKFQVQNQWIMWVSFVFLIIIEIAIFCSPAGRKHPINLILLFLFTLCESYTVSFICAIVAEQNGSQVVVVAAVMTLAIVIALTVYAMFTKEDFTIKWGIVIVILAAMLMLGIFSLFAWSPFLDNLYCCLGVIMCGIYIVIDTQLIIGGKRLAISMDDYVVGALILYMDIITLFLYLLELLSKKK